MKEPKKLSRRKVARRYEVRTHTKEVLVHQNPFSPKKFFTLPQFRRHRHVTDYLWWDGILWTRERGSLGDKTLQIPAALRLETDYMVNQDGKIECLSEVASDEYFTKTVRKIQRVALDEVASLCQGYFDTYRDHWNSLVKLDREGIRVKVVSPRGSFLRKVEKEYIQSRRKSRNPLRPKSDTRGNSIPFPDEIGKELKGVIRRHLNLRSMISCRLQRFSATNIFVRALVTRKQAIGIDSESRTIHFSRDPRLVDLGMALTDQGLSIVSKDAFDIENAFLVPSDALQAQKGRLLNNLIASFVGRVRSIGFMSSKSIHPSLIDFRKKLIKECRKKQAEDAISFYKVPNMVPLGQQYTEEKAWKRKLLRPFEDYFVVQGLTGKVILAKETKRGFVSKTGTPISGVEMANHALSQALAKWDLWPGATFLSNSACRTARMG